MQLRHFLAYLGCPVATFIAAYCLLAPQARRAAGEKLRSELARQTARADAAELEVERLKAKLLGARAEAAEREVRRLQGLLQGGASPPPRTPQPPPPAPLAPAPQREALPPASPPIRPGAGAGRCECSRRLKLKRSSMWEFGPVPPEHPGCRCSHEPELAAAGQKLAQEGAALERERLRLSREGDRSLHYVHFPVLGGFNNQRQCLINAIVAMSLLPRNTVAVLPPATPIAYSSAERWPHDYVTPYDNRTTRWLPWGKLAGWPASSRPGRFETLWDPEPWQRAFAKAGLRTAAAAPRPAGDTPAEGGKPAGEPPKEDLALHAPAGERLTLRQLPLVEGVTRCGYMSFEDPKNRRCQLHNRTAWAAFNLTVQTWVDLLKREPPQLWQGDALCFQVAPMLGTDENCAHIWGSELCSTAYEALRPNVVATAAANIVLRAITKAGLQGWSSVHFQEDFACPELPAMLARALEGRPRGTAFLVTGGAMLSSPVRAVFDKLGLSVFSKHDVMPWPMERLPYEVAGQMDWLLASAAPGTFFWMNYSLSSSFDVYVRQERRRRGLSNVMVPVGQGCKIHMVEGFSEAQRPRFTSVQGRPTAVQYLTSGKAKCTSCETIHVPKRKARVKR